MSRLPFRFPAATTEQFRRVLLDLVNLQVKQLIVMLAGHTTSSGTAKRVLGWSTKSRRDLDKERDAGVLKLCSLLERVFEHGVNRGVRESGAYDDGALWRLARGGGGGLRAWRAIAARGRGDTVVKLIQRNDPRSGRQRGREPQTPRSTARFGSH